jgi:hypothetical protein
MMDYILSLSLAKSCRWVVGKRSLIADGPEDRSLFLSCKRALSPATLQALDDEAGGDPYQLALLIMQQVFGADR